MLFSINNSRLSFALALGFVVTLTACDKAPTTAEKPTIPTSEVTSTAPATQTITVAMDTTYPPYNFQGEKGDALGFDVDILNAIGEKQGFKPNIISQPWQKMEDSLGAGQYNLVMSAVSLNAERTQKFETSDVYAYGQDTIVTKENLNTINTFDDLKAHKVATQAETTSVVDLEKLQGKNSPNLVSEKTIYLAFQDLIQGKVEAVLGDSGVLRYYAKSLPNEKLRFVNQGDYFKPYEMVVLAKKGDRVVIDKFNAGLKQIVADGTYAKIYEKWFGVMPTPDQIPHNKTTVSSSNTTMTSVTTSTALATN